MCSHKLSESFGFVRTSSEDLRTPRVHTIHIIMIRIPFNPNLVAVTTFWVRAALAAGFPACHALLRREAKRPGGHCIPGDATPRSILASRLPL